MDQYIIGEKNLVAGTKKANSIVINELPKLSYFNNKNFNNNIKSFKRILATDGDITGVNQLALYAP